jgi:hypothetical protein
MDKSAAETRALVAQLVVERDVAKLEELAGSKDRAIAKEARRGIHLLRTKGIEAAAPRPAPAPVAATVVREEAEAWITPPDGRGERLISILRPSPSGGLDQIHIRVSDVDGLVDVMGGRGPRKAFRDIKRRFEQQDLTVAPAPLAIAQQIIADGYERTLARGRTPPQGYAGALPIVGAPPPGAAHLPHPALAETTPVAQLSAADARALHELPDLLTWEPDRTVLHALSLRLDEIETSQLLVDDRQRAEARRAAVDRAIEASFEPPLRSLWQRRLLDAAYAYVRAGQTDAASKLRAQADRLGAADFSAGEDAFARALVEKLLPPEPTRPGGTEDKLIVTP